MLRRLNAILAVLSVALFLASASLAVRGFRVVDRAAARWEKSQVHLASFRGRLVVVEEAAERQGKPRLEYQRAPADRFEPGVDVEQRPQNFHFHLAGFSIRSGRDAAGLAWRRWVIPAWMPLVALAAWPTVWAVGWRRRRRKRGL